jgi:tRNA (cmo5U34)-methyltransferase
MSTSGEPDRRHDWHCDTYVQEWIDGDATSDDERQPLLRRVAALIPPTSGKSTRVLDVGGGYGALTAEVAGQLPDAQIVLHDYSIPMITAARQRLARFADRVSFQLADMTQAGWTTDLDGPFDAVVSALAIHNLGDPVTIQRVYRDIFTLLRPGGCFFNLDLLFPDGPALAALYRRDPTRETGWDVHISPASLPAHLGWLRDAGFGEADCIWKDLEQGLLWAYKAGNG